MKKSIQNRIRKGLFPEMPQSFADRLTGALKIGGAFNADQRSAEEAPTAPVLPERSKRRFPFGKIFNGVAAAVLAALCIVIAVFGIILPNVQKTHGATRPDGYRADFPVGKWTLAEVGQNGEAVDPGEIGLWMELAFSDDGSVTVKTVTGGAEGQYVYRYTFADNAIELTAEGGEIPVLPASGTYDPETDTLRFAGADGDGALIFTRMSDAVTPESKMSPEDMLEGLWCALSVDPGEDGLLEIRFYTEAAATERKALIVKDGVSYDGYSYTVEKWEQSQKNTGNLWYRFTFIDGDEELTIDLCMDTDGKEPIYMDWNLDKSEEGQKTYLKCPVIEADELPMQYTEYYGAGEGFVGFLAAVDLNGDGNPVRVKVASNDPNWFIEKGEEPELTVQIGRGEWTANEVLVWDSVIFADLDPNDGHGNVLLSVKRTDGTIFTYELHLEDDTVVCGHVAEGDSKTNAAIPQFIAGKWTLTGIELYGSTGGPETSGLEMYLKFSDKESVTVTTVKETGTDTQTYRWRFVSGNQIELTNKDYVTSSIPYTFLYDAATDTLRMDPDGYGLKGMLIFSRTPDAVIPAGERKEIAELRKQYPEYFGLDTSKGLKVYVWQMAESSYSCALISGTDERSEIEIGMMKGTTIEQMRLILSTYGLEEKEIEVVPFHNPISSYWYEIDNDYKVWIRRLVKENMPFTNEELEGLKSPPFSIADVVYDVDGDGQLETCSLNRGPTSSDITVVFTVYRNGTLAYRNTFDMDEGEMTFSRSNSGLRIAHTIPWNDGIQLFTEYTITIEDGVLVLTDELRGKTVEYWGLDDPQWNMKVTTATAKGRIGGAWYCYDKGLASYPGYDELLLIEFDPDGKHVSFTEDRRHYEGYSWQTDADDPNVLIMTNETTGDVRRATLETDAKLRFETDLNARGDRSEWTYYSLPILSAEDLPYAEPILPVRTETSANWRDMPFCMFDLDGDGEKELIELYWDETSRSMQIKVIKPQTKVKEVQLPVMPQVFTSDEQAILYTVEDVTDPGNLILIDLDSNDGRVNLLVSATRADGTERTYELHVEGDAIVCGHTVEGYCFLNDSEQQELMLATPSDLLGAKYGCREVRGETLEPVDEWLQARALIERIMFVKREENIGDGTLLHLVRALPCEIDGKPATLEPGVYMHLREWNEAMTEIVFLTEDDRWITVHLDGTKPYAVGGIPLTDYFDNAPKG